MLHKVLGCDRGAKDLADEVRAFHGRLFQAGVRYGTCFHGHSFMLGPALHACPFCAPVNAGAILVRRPIADPGLAPTLPDDHGAPGGTGAP